jgi:hypothetical protein
MSQLKKLAFIAAQLDALGMFDLADQVDAQLAKLADEAPLAAVQPTAPLPNQFEIHRKVFVYHRPTQADIPPLNMQLEAHAEITVIEKARGETVFKTQVPARNTVLLEKRLTPFMPKLVAKYPGAKVIDDGTEYMVGNVKHQLGQQYQPAKAK